MWGNGLGRAAAPSRRDGTRHTCGRRRGSGTPAAGLITERSRRVHRRRTPAFSLAAGHGFFRNPLRTLLRPFIGFLGPRPPEDQHLAEMLHRRASEVRANPRRDRLALVAVVAEHAHLDELVRVQRDIDLVQHGGGESVVPDGDYRMQVMRASAKIAALRQADF
jgi:hypothetical protein